LRKAFKALKRIIDFNMLDKPKLNGLTTETTKIELANSYLEKAFKDNKKLIFFKRRLKEEEKTLNELSITERESKNGKRIKQYVIETRKIIKQMS
jgi:hypothetical protein